MVSLSNPSASLSNASTVGTIRTAQPMRQTQLGLRLTFQESTSDIEQMS
jgi:hypothetical protein